MGRRTLYCCALTTVLLSATLPVGSAAATSRWPSWAERALEDSCLDCYSSEDGVIVLEHWNLRLRGGERRGTMRRVVHVFTEDGRSGAQVVLATGEFRRYENVRVWLKLPSGEVRLYSGEDGTLSSVASTNVMDETRILHIDPKGLVPGSTVAVECDVLHVADWPQDLFVLQQSVPVARALVSVDVRRGWRVTSRVAEADNPGPLVTSEETTWEFNDLPARPSGWRGLAPLPPAVILALSYARAEDQAPFETWKGTAQWVNELFRLPVRDQPRVAELAAGLEGSEDDMIREAGLISRRLRYFAVELGWGGYIPRPPETTVRRAFGDCKDKAQLMIDLLRRRDIEAYAVLAVAPSHRYVPDNLPSPALFNHVVVGIPWDTRERRPGMVVVEDSEIGPLRLYDPTLPEGTIQDIALPLHGGAGLILHPRTSALLRIPGNEASGNTMEESNRFRFGPDGAIEATTTLVSRGVLRRMLEGDQGGPVETSELRKSLYSELARLDPEFEILSIDDVQQKADGAWAYGLTYRSPQRLSDFGELKMLELAAIVPVNTIPTPREESDVIYLPLLGTFRDSFDLNLGEWRVLSSTDPFVVENALGRVSLTVSTRASGVEIARVVAFISTRVDRDNMDDALALRDAIRRANGVVMVFEKDD